MPQNEWSGINSPLVSTDGRETTINSGVRMPAAPVIASDGPDAGSYGRSYAASPLCPECGVSPGHAVSCDADRPFAMRLDRADLITLDQALNDTRWTALDARNAAERLGNAGEADAASALMRASGDLLDRVRGLLYGPPTTPACHYCGGASETGEHLHCAEAHAFTGRDL